MGNSREPTHSERCFLPRTFCVVLPCFSLFPRRRREDPQFENDWRVPPSIPNRTNPVESGAGGFPATEHRGHHRPWLHLLRRRSKRRYVEGTQDKSPFPSGDVIHIKDNTGGDDAPSTNAPMFAEKRVSMARVGTRPLSSVLSEPETSTRAVDILVHDVNRYGQSYIPDQLAEEPSTKRSIELSEPLELHNRLYGSRGRQSTEIHGAIARNIVGWAYGVQGCEDPNEEGNSTAEIYENIYECEGGEDLSVVYEDVDGYQYRES